MAASGPHQVEKLRAIPLFSELGDWALEQVARCTNEFEVPAGHVLVERNQKGAGLFIIEQGSVAVSLKDKEIELDPGEFFGELALLDPRSTHVARVRAKTDCKCLAISRDDFKRLLEAEPSIAVTMLTTVARRLVDVTTATA
jgi:CRP-like cAMP-binding protein